MSNIEQVIGEHIRKEFMFDKDGAPLANDTPLIQDGIIDSLGIFMLISFIEDHYGIKVQPEDVVLDNFESIDAITALVNLRLQGTA